MARGSTASGPAAARISNEMVGLLRRYSGRGPTRTRTYLNTNLVCVVFEDVLTQAELSLVAARQVEAVLTMRRTFHEAMREEATGMVENLLERRVLAHLSDIQPEANIAVDTFVLEPREESGLLEIGDATSDPPEAA